VQEQLKNKYVTKCAWLGGVAVSDVNKTFFVKTKTKTKTLGLKTKTKTKTF